MAQFTPTRFLDVKEINAYEAKGIKSAGPIAYAASIAITPQTAFSQHISFAQLTGNLSLTATLTNLNMFDEVNLYFSCDGTIRTITFSTGFTPAGTLALAINKDAVATFVFDGTVLREKSRSIGT